MREKKVVPRTPQQQLIADVFDTAAENCGGKLRMQAAIDATASWCYSCIKRGTVPLDMAMRLEILTRNQFTYKQMCPEVIEKINAVSSYLIDA